METIELLAGQVPVKKFLENKLKYFRQLRSVVKFKQAGFVGSLKATTAFGKTFVARIVLGKIQKKIRQTVGNFKVIIIVPRKVLKDQWESEITHFPDLNIQIHVINGFVQLPVQSCDLLILDEMHLYASPKFKKWALTNYRFLLGLTATMKRMDGEEEFLLQKAPVFDTILHQEALDRGWISDVLEINCPVFLTKEERVQQTELNKKISQYFNFFGDFNLMSDCCSHKGASNYVNSNKIMLTTKEVQRKANIAMKLIRQRKDFIDNTKHKLLLSKTLIEKLDLRTITFSESVEFAEKLKEHFVTAEIYHSNLKTYTKNVFDKKVKSYKTKKGANNFALALRKKGIPFTPSINNGKYELEYFDLKNKKFSNETQKKLAVENITKGKSSLILTAKALDQGFNVDDMEFGLETSRSRNPTQRIQRRGRIGRKFTYPNGVEKLGLYISLYIPDYVVKGSVDESKLIDVSGGNEIWVNDEEEMFEVLKKYNFIKP